jgi:hypothetical protein
MGHVSARDGTEHNDQSDYKKHISPINMKPGNQALPAALMMTAQPNLDAREIRLR